MERVRAYKVTGAVAAASVGAPVKLERPGAAFSVALMDYGYKKSIAGELLALGCAVTVYPHGTPAAVVLGNGHDGVMLSNGPGDPAENTYEIAQIAEMMGRVPLFGICLGHQMMALARGARTGKMRFGHRGANQPAKDLKRGASMSPARTTATRWTPRAWAARARSSGSSTSTTAAARGSITRA